MKSAASHLSAETLDRAVEAGAVVRRLREDYGLTQSIIAKATGASARSVQVAGWPGILLADSSNAAAGVVWEDGRGLLHVVVGILDSQDVLNVANQLG